jgi:hypothetical protein
MKIIKKNKVLMIFILIVVFGSALRLYKLHYGIAGSYVADTQTVSEAMDIGNSLAKGDLAVFAKPVKYPFVLPYLILFLHGVYFIGGRIIGAFHSTSDFFKFIALNQGFSFLIARLISIASGIGAIILSFFIAKTLAERMKLAKPQIAAIVSAFFVSFSLLLLQFSRIERPHAVAGFFIILSYFFYLKFIGRPTLKNGILLGVGVGLAVGTLQSGILTGIFLLLPLIQYVFRKRKEYRNIWGGFVGAAVIFFLSYPFLILSFKKALGLSGGKFDISFSGASHNVFAFTGKGFFEILHDIVFYEPALLVLFLMGFIVLIFKKKLREFLKGDNFGFIGFSALFIIIFGFYDLTLPRYTIPLVIMMAVWAGPLAIGLLEQFTTKLWKILLGVIICLAGLFYLVQDFRMMYLLKFSDTREEATSWLRQNASATDSIIEAQNIISLTPTKNSILDNKKLGVNLGRRDELLLSLSDKDYPSDAKNILRGWDLKVQDYFKFIKQNRIKYIVVSDEGGFRDFNDPLFLFARNNLKLKMIFSPFIKPNNSLFSTFPGDFHNPLKELWGIKQMGPEVRIYSAN